MNFISFTFCCWLLAAIINSSSADEPTFKLNKLNLIWDKARHSLGSNKLKDLKMDLLEHEPKEMNLKNIKAHGQDKDGLIEASVRKNLLRILQKYSLDRYHDDIHPTMKTSSQLGDNVQLPTFRDSKLDKLWKKAEKVGFSQEQLMILHEEFEHQQNKLDEHYKAATLLEEESAKKAERALNSIEESEVHDKTRKLNKRKETPGDKKARLEMNVEQNLRDKHAGIKSGYEKLHQKIQSAPHISEGPFREERVNELWAMASQSNMSRADLQMLKEELHHYDVRIEKLKHFQNQLDRHKLGNKDYGLEEDDESKHIGRKVKELRRSVEKIDKSIAGRISKDEL